MQELNSHLSFPTIIATVCRLSVGVELDSPAFNAVFPPLNVAVISSATFTVGLFAISHFSDWILAACSPSKISVFVPSGAIITVHDAIDITACKNRIAATRLRSKCLVFMIFCIGCRRRLGRRCESCDGQASGLRGYTSLRGISSPHPCA